MYYKDRALVYAFNKIDLQSDQLYLYNLIKVKLFYFFFTATLPAAATVTEPEMRWLV